uniref:Uncharacterized protein n=1 Tax=Wuchereria bancrofti TaxID=6293 RepID=A0A1I8EAV3_WUCBA
MQCVDRRILLIVAPVLFWNSVNARRIFAIDSECTSCSYYTAHICISPFLYSEHLVNSIEKQISSRFEPCLNGSQREAERPSRSTEIMGKRGTMIVAMVECSSRQNWSELADMASAKWADKLSCHFDALIVLFHQWKLIPYPMASAAIAILPGHSSDGSRRRSSVITCKKLRYTILASHNLLDTLLIEASS